MAGLQVEFHPQAVEEAMAARRWYAKRSPSAANVFATELDVSVSQILAGPERWPGYLHGTRRYLLRRFPFSVVFRRKGDVIEIVAIAHAKRRPGYWRAR